jgi:outer membrane murein-binding lipoprotein Lpp
MPNTHPEPIINLQQISTRNTHARHIVAGCASALPTLAGMWHELDDALTDAVTLAAQITRLSADLERTRLEAANLRAAMRAALAAHAEGELDPLWYLRDELNAPQASSAASWRPA